MAIKSKNSGAYADIVGVKVKTAGTYAAVQGIYAKSGGVYGSVYAAGANPVLNVSVASGVAPFGLVFDGVGTTVASGDAFHDYIYYFEFGDGSAANYTYGQLAGKTKNKFLGGPLVPFVYERPGTYTVRLWASDGVRVFGPVSQQITVTDPATVYTTANTYYFHPTVTPVPGVDGVPADATSGNCFTQASFSTIVTSYIATGRRIRLRAGQEYIASVSGSKNNLQNVTLDTYEPTDTGAYAIIKATTTTDVPALQPFPNNTANNPDNWRVKNIHFTRDTSADCTFTGSISGTVLTVSAVAAGAITVGQRVHYNGMVGSITVASFGTGSGGVGTYNLSTTAGVIASSPMATVTTRTNGFVYGVNPETTGTREYVKGRLTMHNCKFTYITGTSFGGAGKDSVVSKCVVDGVASGAAYLSGANGAFFGGVRCAIVDSLVDNKQSGEHCIRVQGADYLAIISSEVSRPGETKSLLTVRGWQGLTDQSISMEYVNVAYNYINNSASATSSPWPSQLAPQNGTSRENIRNAIWENNFYRLSASSVLALHTLARNVSVRNNVVHTPATGNFCAWSVYNDNSAGVLTPEHINIYNNTVYAPSAVGFSLLNTTINTSLTMLKNNIGYAPSATKGSDNNGSAPSVITSSSAGTSTTLGVNSTSSQMKSTDPLFVGPSTTQAGYKLQSGSYAKDAGTDVKVRTDALNLLRVGATFDMGALNAPDKQVDAWSLIP